MAEPETIEIPAVCGTEKQLLLEIVRQNNLMLQTLQTVLQTQEKIIREVEKSILRIVNLEWVLFSDFMKGVYAPVSEGQSVALKKTGKSWKYQRPTYTPGDIKLIEMVVLEHLFEAGVTALGSLNGELCISVTPFGQSLFG